jgi:hypothetical protein
MWAALYDSAVLAWLEFLGWCEDALDSLYQLEYSDLL